MPTNAPNFSHKRCHMREIWVFKDDNWILPANRFREETNPNYIPKHPNRHPSFYFSNLAPLVNKSRRSRKAATNLKPAASHQPPAAFTLPPSIDVHTWTLVFLTYNLCINRQLSLCYEESQGSQESQEGRKESQERGRESAVESKKEGWQP